MRDTTFDYADCRDRVPANLRPACFILRDIKVIAARSVETWHTHETIASELKRKAALEDSTVMNAWCDAIFALADGRTEDAYVYLTGAANAAMDAGVDAEPEQSALAYFTCDDD
jgi:hypothetical protein